MLLISHIVIALVSVFYATFVFVAPTSRRLRVAYGWVGLTVASGTILVVKAHAPILQSCLTGLVFIGVSLSGIWLGARKLASDKQQ